MYIVKRTHLAAASKMMRHYLCLINIYFDYKNVSLNHHVKGLFCIFYDEYKHFNQLHMYSRFQAALS